MPYSLWLAKGGKMLGTLFTGFVGGVAAWFPTDYIAKPLQGFVNLRREISRRLVVYDNVSARAGRDQAAKVEAKIAFRDLAGRMRAFAHVDYYASKIIT
jgi:hypothetical protein